MIHIRPFSAYPCVSILKATIISASISTARKCLKCRPDCVYSICTPHNFIYLYQIFPQAPTFQIKQYKFSNLLTTIKVTYSCIPEMLPDLLSFSGPLYFFYVKPTSAFSCLSSLCHLILVSLFCKPLHPSCMDYQNCTMSPIKLQHAFLNLVLHALTNKSKLPYAIFTTLSPTLKELWTRTPRFLCTSMLRRVLPLTVYLHWTLTKCDTSACSD